LIYELVGVLVFPFTRWLVFGKTWNVGLYVDHVGKLISEQDVCLPNCVCCEINWELWIFHGIHVWSQNFLLNSSLPQCGVQLV